MDSNSKLLTYFRSLLQLSEIKEGLHGSKSETYRQKAFNTVISAIEGSNVPWSLDNSSQWGVGAGNKARITEILTTGGLKEIDELSSSDRSEMEGIIRLTTVPGIGIRNAIRLYSEGYQTVEALTTYPNLNARQLAGLKYYSDLQLRIPRAEIEQFSDRLTEALIRFNHANRTQLTFLIAGSYRRGATSSGDIDMLLADVRPGFQVSSIIQDVVNFLQHEGILYDTLSLGSVKYNGIAQLHPELPFRRFDIEIIDDLNSVPGKILYFTGSKELNVMMRERARGVGWLLNADGLYQNGVRFPAQTEADIFFLLQLPYLVPERR